MPEAKTASLRERIINRIGGYSAPLLWWRARRPTWAWRISSHYGKPTSRYVAENGLTVQRGNFKGLEFPPRALGHTNYLGAKLAGVYEKPVVDFLAGNAGSHEVFVDLGSGDGFFLTGLGRINPDLGLLGYELNGYERRLADAIAEVNRTRLELRERADQEALKYLPEGRLLLLCDLEGLEEDLLDPKAVPRLKDATMAVEAHSQFRPNVVSVLTDRFRDSHEISYVASKNGESSGIPELGGWPEAEASIVLHDGHGEGEGWMFFLPREHSG